MLYRLHTDSNTDSERLDQYLAGQLEDLSIEKVKKITALGGVHINGRRVRKCDIEVQPEQKIEIHIDGNPLTPYRISEADVLYQDKHIIVLNKPCGIDTQPTMARYQGTLYEALQLWLGRNRKFGRKLEIGMAQRLDRDTSGIIIFSIHPHSHKGLTEQIQGRMVTKKYLALVEGHLSESQAEFHSFLAKSRSKNRMVIVEHGGKEAITRYEVQKQYTHCSLVLAQLVTGRMHQIRAHFAEAGHPLIGDTKYGGAQQIESHSFSRQCLHSHILELKHPVTKELLNFVVPLPEDMWLQ